MFYSHVTSGAQSISLKKVSANVDAVTAAIKTSLVKTTNGK